MAHHRSHALLPHRHPSKASPTLWSKIEKNTDKIAIYSFTVPVLQSVFLAVIDLSVPVLPVPMAAFRFRRRRRRRRRDHFDFDIVAHAEYNELRISRMF